ncbi:MAG TPA: c-type cytochrome [Candidatus Acidoferrales bacterium]|nr:c-type cytochrome [Candidatus Acidoferrales bacterium]
MKKFILGILVGFAIVFAGAYVYFSYGLAPVATSDSPMPMERYFARKALHARISREAPKRDASTFTTADLTDGATVYQMNCVFCHGLPGQQESAAAKGMFPDPPQLFTPDGTVTDDPVGVTYWKVKNGIRLTGMPGFHASLKDDEMWHVSALLARADKLPPEAASILKLPAGDPPASTTSSASAPASTPDWKDARQISPEALAAKLAGPKAERPMVLQVGARALYEGGHIPGAIYAGMASTPSGLANLKAEAAKLSKNQQIVIYCGCCPWENCPNVHPAYDELRKMGFTRLVVLLLPQDFAHDWVAQGYPVARGNK